MNSAIKTLLEYWDRTGVRHLPGNAIEQVRAFEAEHGLVLPDVFRAFYIATNGTDVPGRSGTDAHGWFFRKLTDVRPDKYHAWAYVFADFREDSFWVGIDLRGEAGFPFAAGGIYALGLIDAAANLCASSLDDFLRLYVKNDPRIYPTAAREHHIHMLASLYDPSEDSRTRR
jgi:hypothetical protein